VGDALIYPHPAPQLLLASHVTSRAPPPQRAGRPAALPRFGFAALSGSVPGPASELAGGRCERGGGPADG
jgi:hypothetical protein